MGGYNINVGRRWLVTGKCEEITLEGARNCIVTFIIHTHDSYCEFELNNVIIAIKNAVNFREEKVMTVITIYDSSRSVLHTIYLYSNITFCV